MGLEDPDIWTDETTNLMHVYFTIPVRHQNVEGEEKKKVKVHLGHAVGEDLDSLAMTEPVLLDTYDNSAKEISIAPINSKGVRLNLIESRDRQTDTTYSVVKIAIAKEMGNSWEYGETIFHPKDKGLHWIGGHASPGPLFPKSFIDMGENKLLGVINGREPNIQIGDTIKYGTFSVGLFIYNYEEGKIEWTSPESFIEDTDATTITFASQFVEIGKGEGILYAHVDDSFVRAYTLTEEGLRKQLAFLGYK